MSEKYVGITIGPIFDTIEEASFPAALWFGSTMFSDITRRLCVELKRQLHVGKDNLLSPAFDENDKDGLKDGIGKYHDRVIFSIDKENDDLKKSLDDIISKVMNETVNIFNNDIIEEDKRTGRDQTGCYTTFLRKYLQIKYVITDAGELKGGKVILAMSKYLDSLEMMMTFPDSNSNNPVAAICRRRNQNQSQSSSIKDSSLFKNIETDNNRLVNSQNEIWSIEDIASGKIAAKKTYDENITDELKSSRKYKKYYTVVSADADGMTGFLQSLTDNQEVTRFSEKCLYYCKEAAKLISEYGGMPIYAGGDDLLFLAPVKVDGTISGVNDIFGLCGRISQIFNNIMKDNSIGEVSFEKYAVPTISFGIAIQYVKYPLYEALNKSRELLGAAKSFGDSEKKKNCIAVNIEKHSGQSIGTIIGNEAVEVLRKIMNAVDSDNAADDDKSRVIVNFAHALEEKRALIKVIDDMYLSIRTSWDNMFDNADQQIMKDYIHEINDIYYGSLIKNDRIQAMGVESHDRQEKRFNTLLSLLSLSKFFIEKADETEV